MKFKKYRKESGMHGQLGECIYLKFRQDEFDIEIEERFYSSDKVITLRPSIPTNVPVLIDNSTEGEYEAVCEMGIEIH